ncbi:MAG TPA: GTP-binding protein, partial [Rhodopila sp.]|nr:GTP-binding protein [Rhodopila sp.]
MLEKVARTSRAMTTRVSPIAGWYKTAPTQKASKEPTALPRPATATGPIPVSIVTGFLGSGKTTLIS